MSKYRILIVNHEEGMREVCADTLRLLPEVEILLEADCVGAAERLTTEPIDLLIADLGTPVLDGFELLRLARQFKPTLAAIILTIGPGPETVKENLKIGMVDHLSKPFHPAELRRLVQERIKQQRLGRENLLMRRTKPQANLYDGLNDLSFAMS